MTFAYQVAKATVRWGTHRRVGVSRLSVCLLVVRAAGRALCLHATLLARTRQLPGDNQPQACCELLVTSTVIQSRKARCRILVGRPAARARRSRAARSLVGGRPNAHLAVNLAEFIGYISVNYTETVLGSPRFPSPAF